LEVAAALSKEDLYPQALVRFQESYELSKKLQIQCGLRLRS
jgi:hypothetical protein